MHFELTSEQKDAIIKTKKWWYSQNKQLWEISGAAGTGKTTIVKFLIDDIGLQDDEVIYMAYVGKACLELSKKGTPAKTIHSSIYDMELVPKVDSDGNVVTQLGRIETTLRFVKKDFLSDKVKLLVVDEAAMVPTKMAIDILSFGIPVITLGDRNQLDPIFGESYFLAKPDVVLTEPMRQALDSPIIYLAHRAMNGKFIRVGNYGNNCYVIRKDMITDEMITNSDVIICGRNKTRERLNDYIRYDIYKYKSREPLKGDKIICRKNNWNEELYNGIYLINGMVGYITAIHKETYTKDRKVNIDFKPEFTDKEFKNIKIDYNYLISSHNDRQKIKSYDNTNIFEYSYAITCHLSQGSQYKNVLIYDEVMGSRDFYKKWSYTAITRASHSLILAI